MNRVGRRPLPILFPLPLYFFSFLLLSLWRLRDGAGTSPLLYSIGLMGEETGPRDHIRGERPQMKNGRAKGEGTSSSSSLSLPGPPSHSMEDLFRFAGVCVDGWRQQSNKEESYQQQRNHLRRHPKGEGNLLNELAVRNGRYRREFMIQSARSPKFGNEEASSHRLPACTDSLDRLIRQIFLEVFPVTVSRPCIHQTPDD